jgi:hypothetical protein
VQFIHFNIWLFTKKIAKKPITLLTKFSIVILLILQGFAETIVIRLPKNNTAKNTQHNRLSFIVYVKQKKMSSGTFDFLKILVGFSRIEHNLNTIMYQWNFYLKFPQNHPSKKISTDFFHLA